MFEKRFLSQQWKVKFEDSILAGQGCILQPKQMWNQRLQLAKGVEHSAGNLFEIRFNIKKVLNSKRRLFLWAGDPCLASSALCGHRIAALLEGHVER